jgi:hypothetical protein
VKIGHFHFEYFWAASLFAFSGGTMGSGLWLEGFVVVFPAGQLTAIVNFCCEQTGYHTHMSDLIAAGVFL